MGLGDRRDLIEFLIEAKKATYAGKGPEGISSRPRSHDLRYEKDNLLYIDTYLGGPRFGGEEALWVNKQPIWAMNYIGRVLHESFEGDILKEALKKATPQYPYRGPEELEIKGFIYRCQTEGTHEWFKGYEAIYKNEIKVYECYFHGGTIEG